MEQWAIGCESGKISAEFGLPSDIVVPEKFNIQRSFRRGVTTRAQEQGVDEVTIEISNQWRKIQNCQGGLPKNLPMSQLCVEISQALTSKILKLK